MRLAWDGLPRDLDLSREDRAQLRARVRAKLRNDTEWRSHLPRFIEFVPGAGAFVSMLVWMPALWLFDSWVLKITVGLACVVLQIVLTRAIMMRLLWPATCHAMALAGVEVCPRCAFDLRSAEPDRPECTECGASRLVLGPPALDQTT